MLNVRSLSSGKAGELEFDIFGDNNSGFLCFAETWEKLNSINFLHVKNYNLGTFWSRLEFKGGGVSIFTKKDIQFKPVHLKECCIEKTIEICAISYKISNITIYSINCYRAPIGNLRDFLNALYEILESKVNPKCRIILTGDFNIDSYKKSDDLDCFLDMLKCFNLGYLVKWATRMTQLEL